MSFTPTNLTRDAADLLSGGLGLPPALSDADWQTVCKSAEARLLALLCLDSGPSVADANYASWLDLLANWVKAVQAAKTSGIRSTVSKSSRNLSVSFGNNGQVLLKDFYANNADLIGLFTNCGTGVDMQSDWVPILYGPDALQPGDMMPDSPPLMGGAI